MISQTPPKDTPFGLEPNVASGLAYLLGMVGGIVMFVAGGTNPQTRRAAAQSIVMWAAFIALFIVLDILTSAMPFSVMLAIGALVHLALALLSIAAWIWTSVASFQGKDVRVPIVSGIASSIFKTAA
jgi:uncharacterized membrane protein